MANPTAVTVSLISYPGWAGKSYTYRARAKVQQPAGGYSFRAGVQRQFQYSEVPLFQAMFFFEDNLEFYRPADMTVGRPRPYQCHRLHEQQQCRDAHVSGPGLLRRRVLGQH